MYRNSRLTRAAPNPHVRSLLPHLLASERSKSFENVPAGHWMCSCV
jgi:hypothetical protein